MMAKKKNLSGEDRLRITLPEVERWCKGFVGTTRGMAAHYDKLRYIEKYIAKDADVEICDTTSHLYAKGMRNLGEAFLLASANQQQAITLFHQAARRRVFSIGLNILFMKRSGRTISSLPDTVTNNLLNALSTGQIAFIKQQFRIVNDALKGGYGIDTGRNWNDEWRYSAMGLTILGEFFESPVDLDALGWPRDPAWMPLVQYWNSDDMLKVQAVLLDACNIHMARIARSSGEYDSGNFEFSTPYRAVHPTEILAILRLREASGLQTPELDHPLMNTPYAKLTCAQDFKAEPDELLDGLLQAVRQRDPDIAQWWDEALE